MAIVKFEESYRNENAESDTRQTCNNKSELMLTDDGNSCKLDFSPKEGFIKLMRQAEDFLEEDPDVYLLMSQIMFRALRKKSRCNRYKLQPNQALIGDFESCGLTRQRYRDALDRMVNKYELITTKKTNKGTIATILNTDFCDINCEHQEPSKEPTKNHQGTTKEECKKERDIYIKKNKEKESAASCEALAPGGADFDSSFSKHDKKNLQHNIYYQDAGLLDFFNSSILKILPEKAPAKKADAKVFESLLKKYSVEQLQKAITFAHSHKFHSQRTLTPTQFKRNLDQVLMAMRNDTPKITPIASENKDKVEANRKRVMSKFQDLKYYNSAQCEISTHKISFSRGGIYKEVYFKDASFDEQFANMMRLFRIDIAI